MTLAALDFFQLCPVRGAPFYGSAPLGGQFAFFLFSLGIIGTGLLALPVLAGSAAYGISEAMRWRNGLDVKARRAPKVYAVLAVVMIAGMALNFVHLDPSQPVQ
jgi:Mn2+/Fe2+ NRAMP family transporter